MSTITHNAIAHITEVVERVTRTLSNKQISVVQQGMKVGVEYNPDGSPSKVFLPSLSENPSPELVTAIQGFLDREVSSLLYTDHATQHSRRGTGAFKKGMARSLQGLLEDIRTEKKMTGEFRGSAANFNKNHDFAISDIIGPAHKKEIDPKKRMANLAMPALRAAAGSLPYEEFMGDKWADLGPLGSAILNYADEIQNLENTTQTFELAQKIIRKMQEADSDDGEGEDDEDQGKPGNGTDKGEKSDGKGESEKGEGDSDKGESAGKVSADESEKPGNPGEAKSESKVDDLSKNNEDKSLKDPARAEGSGHSGTTQGIQQFADLDMAFESSDWNAKMAEKIVKFANEDKAQKKYTPYSRQYDYVGPFPAEQTAVSNFSRSSSALMVYKTAHEKSHVIQQQIQRLFIAKSLTRYEPGQRRGRINTNALHRLPHGEERIFKRKIESNSKDVAVSLLIDMSGSMNGGNKIQYACIAALMFSNVLTHLGIAHEVSAFTTYSGRINGSSAAFADPKSVNKMMTDAGDEGHGWSRVAPIVNFIAKPFDKRATEEVKKLISVISDSYRYSMCNNVDGESVDIVGRRLLRRKEKKKVMIVMSDGQPAADGYGADLSKHLTDVVKGLSSAGVEMLGLGLMTDSVSRFYPKHQIVRNVEEIPDKILELTRQMVVGV